MTLEQVRRFREHLERDHGQRVDDIDEAIEFHREWHLREEVA